MYFLQFKSDEGRRVEGAYRESAFQLQDLRRRSRNSVHHHVGKVCPRRKASTYRFHVVETATAIDSGPSGYRSVVRDTGNSPTSVLPPPPPGVCSVSVRSLTTPVSKSECGLFIVAFL